MLHITAVIKTDFHHYFYRMVVLKKSTEFPLWDDGYVVPRPKVSDRKLEKENPLTTRLIKRQGLGVHGMDEKGL